MPAVKSKSAVAPTAMSVAVAIASPVAASKSSSFKSVSVVWSQLGAF